MKQPALWDTKDKKEILSLPGPILIVGASGFIGASLFNTLSNFRSDIYGVIRPNSSRWRLSTSSYEHLYRGDINNRNFLEEIFGQLRPQTIFCTYAYGNNPQHHHRQTILMTNILGLNNILETADKFHAKIIVHAGSSSEYGTNCQAPKESDDCRPNSLYAISKLTATHLLKEFTTHSTLKCINLRLYSIYGPLEDPHRLIPQAIRYGHEKQFPPLANPKTSRDFVYIDDAIRAFVKSAIHAKVMNGQSYNIATGIKTDLQSFANLIQEIFSLNGHPNFNTYPGHDWDLNNWWGNSDQLEKILNWKPTITLYQGLTYLKENLHRPSLTPNYQTKLSIVIACYQDANAIPILHSRCSAVLSQLSVDYEIIFVNDASPSDDENEILKISQQDHHVIGISHSRNFGSQAAFLSGMELATGDAVVIMDGDGQDPPELIEQFFYKWQEGFDIVYGVRSSREAPFFMQIGYKLFYRLFNYLSAIAIPLDAGDFSLLSRHVVNELLALPERDYFLRGLRAWIGFKQVGIPYHRPKRLFGQSTNNLLSNLGWTNKAIYSFSTKPIRFIYLFSLFCVLGAIFSTRYSFISTVIFTTSSIILLSIAFLGEYLIKITEESKQRKRFIREAIIMNGERLSLKVGNKDER